MAELTAAQGGDQAPEASPVAGVRETLICEVKDNMSVITLNRPAKKNAFTRTVRSLEFTRLKVFISGTQKRMCIYLLMPACYFCLKMYNDIIDALKEAGESKTAFTVMTGNNNHVDNQYMYFTLRYLYQLLSIVLHVVIHQLIGAGDYYSSGNDLSNFMEIDPSNMHEASREGGVLLG